MKKNAAVLLYPGCIFFEIALAVETLEKSCHVGYFTPDATDHCASNGAVIRASGSYSDLAQLEVDCVLIPGGDPGSIIPDGLANECLKSAHARGALLAGICAGDLVLASTGLLKGVRATHNYTLEYASEEAVAFTEKYWEGIIFERADLVRDGRIITAQPWAYAAFAAAVAQDLGVGAHAATDY